MPQASRRVLKANLLSYADEYVETGEVTVLAVVPEFHLAKVAAPHGRHFSITRHTVGLQPDDLREGQPVSCLATRRLPRVVRAQLKL